MPPVVKAPLVRHIMLNLPTDVNPEQDAYVDIRQATQREQERRAALDSETTRVYRSETQSDAERENRSVEVKYNWTFPEQQRLEVFLTLAGSNIEIPDPDDEDKTVPLFRYQKDGQGRMRVAMTEDQFAVAWGMLPVDYVNAIYEAVLKVNPQWSPDFRPKSNT